MRFRNHQNYKKLFQSFKSHLCCTQKWKCVNATTQCGMEVVVHLYPLCHYHFRMSNEFRKCLDTSSSIIIIEEKGQKVNGSADNLRLLPTNFLYDWEKK